MIAKHQRSGFFLDSGIFDDLSCFDELEKRIANLPINKDKGDAFEVFAEAYLATQNIIQSKHVWPFELLPLSIAQDLQLDTGRDMGVDGVIETPLGLFDAYQVKFRNRRPKLKWEELSTFMGLTDRVNQRILFTNCDDFPKLMNDRTGFFCIRGSDLDRLQTSDFDTIKQWLATGIIKVIRKHPLPHQAEALGTILPALEQQDRATAVMACGTGKTLVALWVAERMQCKSIVVLLPSLSLVRQTLHEWLKETSWSGLSYLCICSDSSVSRSADSVAVQQSDLDFSVTTDPDQIRQFLDARFSGMRLVFSTYQSAHLLGQAMGESSQFDLGIFDEAHKTTGKKGAKFGFALSDDNLAIRKRLFLTATPRHYNINKKNKEGDATLLYSMDSTDVYGPVVYSLSFSEAAKRDIICDYKVVISIVTSEMLGRELIQNGEVLIDGDTVKAQQVASQVAISQAVEKYGVNRIFSFHASVASARSFTSETGEGIGSHLRRFDLFHVNGAMPTSKRAHVMKAFAEADRAVISNARCLTEGVDVPAVDMVAFMSPKKSKVDIVQATGRAMRKSPGKEVGYVLIPLFLEMEQEEAVEDALERTGLEDIWNVLQAMQEQDEELVDVIRQMREDKGRTGGFNDALFREKVEILSPELSLETLQHSISAACVDRLGASWDERYGELKAYKEKVGDCLVPRSIKSLGIWVTHQRVNGKEGKIDKSRFQKLDELGFIWDVFEARLDEMFKALIEYKSKYGDCNVPNRFPENPSLGSWVGNLRYSVRTEKLNVDQMERLNSLGFSWSPEADQWESMFAKLSNYQLEHGHCKVPLRWPQDTTLGTWVSRQRLLRNKTSKHLSEERIDRLNSMGFIWDQDTEKWERRISDLIEYKVINGDILVPNRFPENPELGQWVARLRKVFKGGILNQDRIDQLNNLGFVWNPDEAAWEKMFEELAEYLKQNGDCNVPNRYPNNPYLGQWVGAQRSRRNQGKILTERIKQLDDLGFIWDTLEQKWEEMFSALLDYKKEYGNCNVPGKWAGNRKLGTWVTNTKRNKNAGALSAERVNRLKAISFEW